MGQTFEYLKMALQNIRANKGRSLLTMLGIIIGISSVITIMSVGAGFKNEMNKQLDSIAGGQIYLYLSDEGQKREEYMTEDDFAQIESKIDGVTGTSPVFGAAGSTKTLKGEFTVNLTGGGTAQQEISKWKVVRGRYFNQSDIDTANRVCVVSKKDAISMFGTDDVVGMNIEIALDNSTGDFQIIGIVEQENLGNMVTMEYGDEQSVSMDVPYTAMDVFGYDTSSFAYLYITTDKSADTGKVANAAIALLNQLHYSSGESYYDMENFTDQMSSINDMLNMITGFISLVAGISLLVGGIGVMNIMLVSVTERTREIGIRKSLGAKTSSIMMQFLAESAIIACIGGLIGITIGVALAYAVCSIPTLGFTPGIKLSTILLATVFSSGIGIVFGVYPARKAAKLSPIEALRRN